MTSSAMRRGARAGFVAAVFAAGYLCGTSLQPTAQAQMPDTGTMGKEMMGQAAGAGGPLGQAAELGTTITDMQESVNSLQKNIEVLNKIKSALGG